MEATFQVGRQVKALEDIVDPEFNERDYWVHAIGGALGQVEHVDDEGLPTVHSFALAQRRSAFPSK